MTCVACPENAASGSESETITPRLFQSRKRRGFLVVDSHAAAACFHAHCLRFWVNFWQDNAMYCKFLRLLCFSSQCCKLSCIILCQICLQDWPKSSHQSRKIQQSYLAIVQLFRTWSSWFWKCADFRWSVWRLYETIKLNIHLAQSFPSV